jgi:hypothetical protein
MSANANPIGLDVPLRADFIHPVIAFPNPATQS